MAEPQEACRFKPPKKSADLFYECRHPIVQDGLCIFHLHKYTEMEKQAMAQEECEAAEFVEGQFRQAFFLLLEKEEKNPDVEDCNFCYFHFPTINLFRRQFAKPVKFIGSTFGDKTKFQGATFANKTNFGSVTFGNETNFGAVTFGNETYFGGATFGNETYFGGANFGNETKFWYATFGDKTNFVGAIFFGDKNNFVGAIFGNKTNFGGVTFGNETNFGAVTFGNETYFGGATFGDKTTFSGAIFNGKTEFEGTGTFESTCFFRRVILSEKAEIAFIKAKLSQVSFMDTDLERIHFQDVIWPSKDRRRGLWDEFQLDDIPFYEGLSDYEKIAENYRQLVLNYEAKRDFDAAEDFHIGEMEMRRKKKGDHANTKAEVAWKAKHFWTARMWRGCGVVCEWVNGYAAYRFLSKYGTSYWRGGAVLLFWIALFSGFFLYTGFAPSKENVEISRSRGGVDSIRVIEYNICPDATHRLVSFGRWTSDYIKSVLLTLSILTFQKEKFYEPANEKSQFVLYIAVLVLPAQTALIFLAIRRRYKR